MANPTPRTDALRAMREAKFEAEQRRMKQEAGKPATAPRDGVKPAVASNDVEAGMAEKAAAKEAVVEEVVAKKATVKKTAAKKPAKAKVAKKAD